MEIMLDEIADLLTEHGLTVVARPISDPAIEGLWHVSDLAAECVIQVMITRDATGNPEFWTRCFAAYAADYIVPIVARIGDARDEVLCRRANARPPGRR